MKKTLLLCFLTIIISGLQAQDKLHFLLKGSMNDRMPLSMYLSISQNECTGANEFQGMYKYDGVSEWLPLEIHSNTNMQVVMVELGFTGLMIVTFGDLSFKGYWYSPDNKKKLPLYLNYSQTSEEELEKLSSILAEKYYEYLGC